MEKFKKGYTTVAILFFNTFLILVLLNIFALVYGVFDKEAMAANEVYTDKPLEVWTIGGLGQDFPSLQTIYYTRDQNEIVWIELETANIPFGCEEGTNLRVEAYEGTFFHIHEAGFRWNDRGGPEAWPPAEDAYNIFVFGGSTTFAYSEADNLTIPAWLQYHLRTQIGNEKITVYNFGTPLFALRQERIRFQRLVSEGYIPDAAIFIDGLNDFARWEDAPYDPIDCAHTNEYLEELSNTLNCRSDELCLPLQRLITNLSDRPVEEAQQSDDLLDTGALPPPNDDEATNRDIIARWLDDKQLAEATAREHNIELLFIMQPAPFYGYDLENHLLADERDIDGKWGRHHFGYPIWNEMFDDPDADWTSNVLNLTRLGEDNEGPIYLSKVHYTFDFMNEIAQAITDEIIVREWIQ